MSKVNFVLLTLIFVGIFSLNANAHDKENRYPIEIEYALIDQCISLDDRPLSKSQMIEKRDMCFNFLKEVQKYVTYDEYKNNPDEFLSGYILVIALRMMASEIIGEQE